MPRLSCRLLPSFVAIRETEGPSTVSSRKPRHNPASVWREPLSCPIGIAATIQYRHDQDGFLDKPIIDGKRKSLGNESVIAEHDAMHAPVKNQGVDIRIERVKKVWSQTRRTPLVEAIPFFEIACGSGENFYLHATFRRILSLASSQSDTPIVPPAKAASRSRRMGSCQWGESKAGSA